MLKTYVIVDTTSKCSTKLPDTNSRYNNPTIYTINNQEETVIEIGNDTHSQESLNFPGIEITRNTQNLWIHFSNCIKRPRKRHK